MCVIYRWNEVTPDGRLLGTQQRHVPCPNGSTTSPCYNSEVRRLHDFPPSPDQKVDTPKPLKKQEKRDSLRMEFRWHIPGTSRSDDDPKKKKKAPAPVVVVDNAVRPTHPQLRGQPPMYISYPVEMRDPMVGPSRQPQLPPTYQTIRPGFEPSPRHSTYHRDGANMVDIEPNDSRGPRRSHSTRRRSPSPSPPTREHMRRSNSVRVHSSRSHRIEPRYENRRPAARQSTPPPTHQEQREARQREVEAQLRLLRAEFVQQTRRNQVDREIAALQQELNNLERDRSDGRHRDNERGRDSSNNNNTRRARHDRSRSRPRTGEGLGGGGGGPGAGFNATNPNRRTNVVHQGDRLFERTVPGLRNNPGAPRRANPWDSGVDINEQGRQELDERGARVLADAVQGARLRGGRDSTWSERLLGEGETMDRWPARFRSSARRGPSRDAAERVVFDDGRRKGRWP